LRERPGWWHRHGSMMSPSRRRLLLRIWFLLSVLLFAATCADRIRPYLKSIAGAKDVPAAPVRSAEPRSQGVRLASWNLEFLDVSGRGPDGRSAADYAALARYVQALNADVIAVQEVASVEALKLVFSPEVYAYHLAERGGKQRAGFVFKRDLGVEPQADLGELSLHDLRAGADVALRLNGSLVRLLSVHLKAFCVTGSLAREDKDCRKLRAQVPVLEGWIDARAREGTPFVVLGDFNRALGELDDALFRELDDNEPVGLRLVRAGARVHSSCHGKRQWAVDHVLLGGSAGDWLSPSGLTELRYEHDDLAAGLKLSDHCPIHVTLAPGVLR
jgi:endonuclease/exonuclease/phosphatase family metal-dependent hydrolase